MKQNKKTERIEIRATAEVADALKIGTSYAYRIVKSGKLKAYKDGKDWKIPKEWLIQYIASKNNPLSF